MAPKANSKSKMKRKLAFPEQLKASFVELIRKTSAELPKDVVDAIDQHRGNEEENSRGRYAMDIIGKNIKIARAKSQPLCQDTGSVLFYVYYPAKLDQELIEKTIRSAVKEATVKGYLRQNSVDAVTGKLCSDNLGPGAPSIHFHPWKKDSFDVRLILKGGGCENVGAQYSLPDSKVGAGRDLDGVRRCIMDALVQAQGKGCGPGILGVIIGGDRATGYMASKEQFLRKMTDKNKDAKLDLLEKQIVEDANRLGIGPMGFGGKTTLLGCKISSLNRVPASFFVSISYMCWAYRRQGFVMNAKAEIQKWLY